MEKTEEKVIREAQGWILEAQDALDQRESHDDCDMAITRKLMAASVLLDTILPVQKPQRKRRTKKQMEDEYEPTFDLTPADFNLDKKG